MNKQRYELVHHTPLIVDIGAATEEKYREDGSGNQDAYFRDVVNRTAGVLDGLGRHPGSDAASRLGAKILQAELPKIPREFDEQQTSIHFLELLKMTNGKIIDLGEPNNEEKNPASTVCALKLFDSPSGYQAMFGHAGDTRGKVTRQGLVIAETLDHRDFPNTTESQRRNIQTEMGAANAEDELENLAKHYFEKRDKHLITSCLGSTDAEFTITTVAVKPGDIFTLTSDDVTGGGNLSTSEFLACLSPHYISAQHMAQKIVRMAHSRSLDKDHFRSHPDDLTAVVFKIY